MPVEGLLCSQILSHALCGLPNLKDVHIDPLSRKISAIEIFNHLEALSGTELTVGTSYPLCAFIQALAEASKTLQTFSLGWDDSRYSEEERESFREIAGVRPSVRRFLRLNGAHNYLNAHDLNEASNSIEPDRLISLFYQLKELKITGLKGPYMSDGAQNIAGVTHQTLSHISMLTDVDLGGNWLAKQERSPNLSAEIERLFRCPTRFPGSHPQALTAYSNQISSGFRGRNGLILLSWTTLESVEMFFVLVSNATRRLTGILLLFDPPFEGVRISGLKIFSDTSPPPRKIFCGSCALS